MKHLAELIMLVIAASFVTSCQHTLRRNFCEEGPYSSECGCVYYFDKKNIEKNFSLKRIDDLLYCDQLFYSRPRTGIEEVLNHIYSRPPTISTSEDQN